jgi:hypothetical protein
MIRRGRPLATLALVAMLSVGSPARAADRYAVVVTGASGGPEYAARHDRWRTAFVTLLREQLGYPGDRVFVLAEEEAEGVRRATKENVRAVLREVQQRATAEDVVLVLLMGHGTVADVDEAKFNLVGPDLTAAEWAALVDPIAARLVFVNAASGSFPFLEALAADGRIVITSTDSPAQQFATMLPEFLVRAFGEEGADLDKDGRVSLWEAFVAASDGVREWFAQRGQLATERPLLDDTGEGRGREAGPVAPGTTSLAQVTFLAPEAGAPSGASEALTDLIRQRAEVQARLDRLRANRGSLPPDAYDAELEGLLLEIAVLDREIRSRS